MRNFIVTIIALLLSVAVSIAQPTFPYNGVKPKDVTSVVFTHATVQVDYQTRIEDATVIIEKGKVVSVGRDLKIPSNAVVMDLMGKYVYPSFIDLHSEYGLASTTPSPGIETRGERRQVADVGDKGALGWNPAIHAEYNAALQFSPKDESAKELRSMGFGAVLTLKQDGIVRGTSALVSLGENANIALIRQDAAAHYSFNKGSSSNAYPSSLMGSIALLRQTYYDANWYRDGGNREERNLSLEAFNRIRSIPQIFDAGEKWNVLRADKVGDEFNVQYIIKTGGNEYQRLAEIKATKAALIVPIVFPDVYDVSDPFLSRLVSLEEMKHWELAPSNCATLAKEQIRFAITSSGFQEKSLFLKNLRKAVKRGLSEQEALKALTLTPAQMINAESELGKIQPGMWANFFIASKNIFEEDAVIYENWVQGKPYVIEVVKSLELAGQYQLKLPKHTYDLNVKEDGGKVKADVKFIQQSKDSLGNARADTISYSVNLVVANELITMTFEAKDSIYNGVIRFSGDVADDRKSWSGKGEDAKGGWFDWTCIRTSDATEKKKESKKDSLNMEVGEIIFPFTAYGNLKLPKQETFLIKNATVWTCDVAGKLEDGSVLIVNGKIAAVGKNIDGSKYPDARVIDAKGKHVTPGIIDEHSHIALASVNEGSQASSAEVQQASVIYPEDINIYRQLSGGVTASQLLHGSANPIGGQSALIKLRWGQNADELLIKGASGFIKFALGENVKQSNWANDGSRFPQTRMGVEQIYYDHFIRAREYGDAWKGNQVNGKNSSSKLIRRDLEMDALYEILERKRFVTCHSYVQSEINMLMHVADSMHFTINTFTHILEGYKVADKMKAHGAGASSFSDWWAYKFEVKDAIPYNGALLWEQGITVAFNSDDAEMARRLNQEAAKAVKYGGVPEEEALKFVTLNPAKLLHLDKQMGSLVVGKDADLVIWSDHPLSIYAKAEKTFVDGICYYDIEKDLEMRKWIETERSRLIQKMMLSKQNGDPSQAPSFKDKKHFHCDTMDQTSQGVLFNK